MKDWIGLISVLYIKNTYIGDVYKSLTVPGKDRE
jgi:hypothetical protein